MVWSCRVVPLILARHRHVHCSQISNIVELVLEAQRRRHIETRHKTGGLMVIEVAFERPTAFVLVEEVDEQVTCPIELPAEDCRSPSARSLPPSGQRVCTFASP